METARDRWVLHLGHINSPKSKLLLGWNFWNFEDSQDLAITSAPSSSSETAALRIPKQKPTTMPGTFCSHFSGFARYAWVKYDWAATFDDCWYALVTVVKTCQDDIGSGIFVALLSLLVPYPFSTWPWLLVRYFDGRPPQVDHRRVLPTMDGAPEDLGFTIHMPLSEDPVWSCRTVLSHMLETWSEGLDGRQSAAKEVRKLFAQLKSHPGWEWV